MDKEKNAALRQAVRLNLINLRMTKGLTQGDIASETGKSCNAVGSWEQGLSLPDISTLYRLSTFYGVSMEYFFENKPKEE